MIFHLKYLVFVWKRYDLALKLSVKMVWFSVILVWSQYWQQCIYPKYRYLKDKSDPTVIGTQNWLPGTNLGTLILSNRNKPRTQHLKYPEQILEPVT